MERQRPNTDFDETHFFDYLVTPPSRHNSLKNTFKGARKYYRFMERVELEFVICFRISDQDGYYSVDKLTQKVKERVAKRKGNMMILKQRAVEKDRYYFESSLITFLLGLYIWLGVNWITTILTLIIGLIIFWIIGVRVHQMQHNKMLYQKFLTQSD